MQYAALFSMPIQELARRFTELQAAQAAAERVQSLLDTEPEISDAPEVERAIAALREVLGIAPAWAERQGLLERLTGLEAMLEPSGAS